MIYTADKLAAHLTKRGANVRVLDDPDTDHVTVMAAVDLAVIRAFFDADTGRYVVGHVTYVRAGKTSTRHRSLKRAVDALFATAA